jgi:tripartite-type tricarboxylate transporter receptor subunit TctC
MPIWDQFKPAGQRHARRQAPARARIWRAVARISGPRVAAVAIAVMGGAGTSGAEDYYKGRTLRIVVGTPTGGGYDTYARLIARHIGDAIPGRPAVIVSNMPGASGTKAAYYLYAVAPKDGSVIASFNKSMPLYQALGQVGGAFRTEQMSWIGSVSQTADVLTVWHTTGVRTIADARRRDIVMGADSGGGTMSGYPSLLNATLGTRFKIVLGYAGGPAVDHAMEQGEVEGRGSNPWTSWKATKPNWVRDRLIVPLVQVGLRKEPDLPDVPLLTELAETDEQRAIFTLISAPASIERPFAGPPGLAREPLEILRRAFDQTVRSPAFLADAARQNLDVDPRTGEAAARVVADIVGTPAAIVQKLKDSTSPKDGEGRGAAPDTPN